MDYIFISNFKEALDYAFEEPFLVNRKWAIDRSIISEDDFEACEMTWVDIRENESAHCLYTDQYYQNKEYEDFENEISKLIRKQLVINDHLLDLEEDIFVDLIFISLNLFMNGNEENFWNQLKSIYLSGFIPVGLNGEYPNCEFIVL